MTTFTIEAAIAAERHHQRVREQNLTMAVLAAVDPWRPTSVEVYRQDQDVPSGVRVRVRFGLTTWATFVDDVALTRENPQHLAQIIAKQVRAAWRDRPTVEPPDNVILGDE